MLEVVSFSGLPDVAAVRPGILLRRWQPADRDQLTQVVNENLDYLHEWMPWAHKPSTAESSDEFLQRAAAQFDAGTEFSYGVFDDEGRLLGAGGIHARVGPGAVEIGYWIAQKHSGRGLGTAAARAMTSTAGCTAGVQRVEIHCDEANTRSAAIPRTLGYELVAVDVRPPATPAETDRHLIWAMPAERARLL